MADLTGQFYAGDAIHGYGAEFLVGDGSSSPEGFEAVADVISITPPTTSTADVPRTHLRSPGAHTEKIPGMRDSNAFTIRCNYRPKTHESHSYAGGGSGAFANGGIPYLAEQRTIFNSIIRLNDGSPKSEMPITGYINSLAFGDISTDGKIEMIFGVMPSVSFTAGLP